MVRHDRTRTVTVKELLSTNSGYGSTLEDGMQAKKTREQGNQVWEFSSSKAWKEATRLEEVVEALHNFVEVVFMVRSQTLNLVISNNASDWSG